MRTEHEGRLPTQADLPSSVMETITTWPTPEAKRWAFEFARAICPDPNTQALLLIGSIVRPVADVQDVDLLYIYGSRRPDFADHPLDVDVRVYAADEVSALIAAGHDLLGWSVRYGRLICERSNYWSQIVDRFKTDLPLPSPAVAEARASRAESIYEELRRIGDVEAAHEQLISLLTHRAWARLLRAAIYPVSRPELADQLRALGDVSLATQLEDALRRQTKNRATSGVRTVRAP